MALTQKKHWLVMWLLKSTIVDLVHVHRYGSRSMMEQEDGTTVDNFSVDFSLFHTSFNIYNSSFGEEDVIPRVGDIWIPMSCFSPNHFICFFILGIDHLLQVGDKVLRVEARGGLSSLRSWILCQKLDQKFKWQLESFDGQSYMLQFSNKLSPVIEGRQVDFFT
jgi:hypothetical protein